VRQGERFWITPRGGLDDAMSAADLVAGALDVPRASSTPADAPIHCAIYRRHPEVNAILHSRGPYSVAVSLAGRDFEPADLEGARLLGSVPVLNLDPDALAEQAPAKVANALASCPVCIIARQGVYAGGEALRDAVQATATLELSARIHAIARDMAVL
jgi:L-fuculose-phosphate aldolase